MHTKQRHSKTAHPVNGTVRGTSSASQEEAPVFDLETRVTDEHQQALKLWLRMLACTTRIENEIRLRLREHFETTPPRFDLMAQLQRHPEGLTMGELTKRMMVTGGNTTGITDQLEQEKLVVRVPVLADRRVYQVKLTTAGKRVFAKMAAAHEAWVAELLGGLSVTDKEKLSHMLFRLKKHLNAPVTEE